MDDHMDPRTDISKEIYKQICDEHRFYGDMRFKQLSLYGVITALLVSAANANTATSAISMKVICMIALVSTSVLWVMEVRSSIYGYRLSKRKEKFEKKLANHPFETEDPVKFHWTLLNATNMVLALYLLSYFFWFWRWSYAVAWQAPNRIAFLLLWWVILISFSFREYWQRWREHASTWSP